jgi:hypothetical protein
LTSIAALHLGCEVISVDKSPVTTLLAENLSTYRDCASSVDLPPCLFNVIEADWMNTASAALIIQAALKGRTPELLICSDCLYQSASVAPLVDLINTVKAFSLSKA